MAKDRFYPKKPHVNVGTVAANLMGAGFSPTAAMQVAQGQFPTAPEDQRQMVAFLQEVAIRTDIQLETVSFPHEAITVS